MWDGSKRSQELAFAALGLHRAAETGCSCVAYAYEGHGFVAHGYNMCSWLRAGLNQLACMCEGGACPHMQASCKQCVQPLSV